MRYTYLCVCKHFLVGGQLNLRECGRGALLSDIPSSSRAGKSAAGPLLGFSKRVRNLEAKLAKSPFGLNIPPWIIVQKLHDSPTRFVCPPLRPPRPDVRAICFRALSRAPPSLSPTTAKLPKLQLDSQLPCQPQPVFHQSAPVRLTGTDMDCIPGNSCMPMAEDFPECQCVTPFLT
jgi:hypothetical protein